MKRGLMKKRNYIIGCVVIVLFGFIFYQNSNLTKREYEITSDKVTEASTFVLLTDLHGDYYGKNQSELIAKVEVEEPDAIFLSGDIFDDVTAYDGAIELVNQLPDIAPTFYVTGNHEYWSDDIENIKDIITEAGVVVLEDETNNLFLDSKNITISGIEDPARENYVSNYDQLASMDEEFSDLSSDSFNILVAHRPERYELYNEYNFDLILSGHAHGGQVRIPFLMNGLLAPNQGFFPEYAGGYYEFDSSSMIVSRGLVSQLTRPRLFNNPEYIVIDAVPSK